MEVARMDYTKLKWLCDLCGNTMKTKFVTTGKRGTYGVVECLNKNCKQGYIVRFLKDGRAVKIGTKANGEKDE
jgi:hypothetical protein